MAYADVYLIGDYIKSIERNADELLNACRDICLAVNARKIKYTYEVCKLNNDINVLFTKVFIFSNINVIPFKIVPLGSYTPMETLFPRLVATLEVFNRYGL